MSQKGSAQMLVLLRSVLGSFLTSKLYAMLLSRFGILRRSLSLWRGRSPFEMSPFVYVQYGRSDVAPNLSRGKNLDPAARYSLDLHRTRNDYRGGPQLVTGYRSVLTDCDFVAPGDLALHLAIDYNRACEEHRANDFGALGETRIPSGSWRRLCSSIQLNNLRKIGRASWWARGKMGVV